MFTIACYSVYLSFKYDDCLKQQGELVNKLLPPDIKEFESRMVGMDNFNRAFAYMDYNSLIELQNLESGNRLWTPQKITNTKPTYHEYQSLHEFKLANKGYDEYLKLLGIKYGREIPLYPLSFWFDKNENSNVQKNNMADK
jgi:hypothetical protein